nr:MAG TPA: hypothetical protein [Inoviridae sp.]
MPSATLRGRSPRGRGAGDKTLPAPLPQACSLNFWESRGHS